MINEKEILKEIDERIAIQNRNIERVMQVSNNQAELALLEREIATYQSVKKLIKEKCTPEAATPEGADINNLIQEQYNTDQKKIEPIKLAQEIFALCMKIQEGEDGRIEHRNRCRSSEPAVFVDFYGHTAQLDVSISPIGWTEDDSARERFGFYMGDYWDQQEEERAIECKERLIELLEERRGNNNGKDNPDHN